MVQHYSSFSIVKLFLGAILLLSIESAAQCSSVTPTFTLDLSGAPNASTVSPSSSRNGTCCGGSVPCTKLYIILHPGAMGLKLTPTGADPGGSLTYEFNCNGVQLPGGTPICLPGGAGTATLTICKVGNNANSYAVESIPRPAVQQSVAVRDGCTQTITASGYSVPTVQWTAINAGTNTALFNSYLSCTAACLTVVVTPTGTVPAPFIDYEVSGFGQSPCGSNFYRDTVRVFFYNNLAAAVNNTAMCFGTPTVVLTATASGGRAPHTYTWLPGGSSATTAASGPGIYTVVVGDQTGCPPVFATATVTMFTVAITAQAGTDFTVCKSSPGSVINGTVTGVSTGSWSSTGAGTFQPSASVLSPTFIPAPGVVASGSTQLLLHTTNNAGCAPDTDTVTVFYQTPPAITPLTDYTVCANNATTAISGNIVNYPATPLWSVIGSGTVSPANTISTSFTAGAAAIANGSVRVVMTTTNNGLCPPARDTLVVHITPKPVVNAGPNFTICSNGVAPVNGSVTAGASTGSWSSSGDGTFANPAALSTTYTPGVTDLATGIVTLVLSSTNNGNCLIERDTLVLTIAALPTVVIGPPGQYCSSAASVALTSTVSGATTTGSWTSSGSGSFVNPNMTTPVYNISPADQLAGVIGFTVTSTNNGVCPAVSTTTMLTIAQMATVTAGLSQTICSMPGTVSLSGTVTSPFGTGVWSATGTGTVVPGSGNNATYSLSVADFNAGTITFSITSTNNGVCPAVTATLNALVVPIATVSAASANATICSLASTVGLSGSIAGANGTGIWSTNGTGVLANASSFNPVYTISNGDRTNGQVNFTLTSTGNGPCATVSSPATISITPNATVNAGLTQTICSNQNTIALSGSVLAASGNGTWAASGNGSFPGGNASQASYSFTQNDADNGAVIFTLTSTGNGVCPAETSTVQANIVKIATVSAASSNATICSSAPTVSLSGTVTGANGTAVWTHNGSGSLDNSTSLSPTYTISNNDIVTGAVVFTLASTGNGPCPAITTNATVYIVPIATVVAGPSQSICSSQSTISLHGTVIAASGNGTWTSSGGGIFTGVNGSSSTYSVAPIDVNNGFLTFTLTSTGNSVCPAATSTLNVSITKSALVNAGANTPVCSDNGNIALSGTVTSASGTGVWSGGSNNGGYSPSNSVLSPSYAITAADIAAGFVTFTLTSTNDGPCGAVVDTVRVPIVHIATVSAGSSQTLCSAQGSVQLSGSVAGVNGEGIWSSSGGGIFSPLATSLTGLYVFSQADVLSGMATLTLTSINNGPCAVTTSTMSIKLVKQPTVAVAGPTAICTFSPLIALSGTVDGGSNSGVWLSSGSGDFIPGNTSMVLTYSISPADIAAGSVNLILHSTNHFPCAQESDTLRVDLKTPPTANAGIYGPFCSSQSALSLNGIISGASGTGKWTSNGTGNFSPSDETLNAQYVISDLDAMSGFVTLTLVSTGNGACPQANSQTTLQIKRQATVEAGPDQSICSSQKIINISGNIIGVTTSGNWSTTGGGTFLAGANSLFTGYSVSDTDLQNKSVYFTLTSTENDVCPPTSDSLLVTIVPKPVLALTADTALCAKTGEIALIPQASGLFSGVFWSSSGSGTFTPNSFSHPVTYHFSAADVSSGNVNLTLLSPSNSACGNLTANMKLRILPSPRSEFTLSEYTITLPGNPVVATNKSAGAVAYRWDFGEGNSITEHSPHYQYTKVGYYDVSLIVENQFECTDTATTRVLVIRDVLVPTAFTPNGTGDPLNELFRPFTDGVTEYDLMIFNRWGELIFRTNDINQGWDGRFNGKECQQDAYVWKASMKFFDGRKYEKTGSVTLIK